MVLHYKELRAAPASDIPVAVSDKHADLSLPLAQWFVCLCWQLDQRTYLALKKKLPLKIWKWMWNGGQGKERKEKWPWDYAMPFFSTVTSNTLFHAAVSFALKARVKWLSCQWSVKSHCLLCRHQQANLQLITKCYRDPSSGGSAFKLDLLPKE